METTTVRISRRAHAQLRQLAERTGQPMRSVLEKAVDAYDRERFFADLDAGFSAVWADPIAAREEMDDRAMLNGTLADGLTDD